MAPFRVVPLASGLDRTGFNSATGPLDQYFREQVTQDIRRRVTACFIAFAADEKIAGYYTLATASLPLTDLPGEIIKKLPRYPSIPTVRMGRLAVDQNFRSLGLGGALLADALQRCVDSEITAYALLVDAIDETAADFYRHHGFLGLPEARLTLFLPLATVRKSATGG